ncbi:catalase family protein [Trichocoleus sp. FACHB-591]|uniref:catalase family protein n=1 Tax=Trichocoleus sp. FACHB-591 TaxID=2692872 RepID=UPI00168741A1|nr:catalase family protein [Trichocoleus sp. FACHB-591]MBD2095608.1 catalase family protein [Trichocoleus sp. FACHB-591]
MTPTTNLKLGQENPPESEKQAIAAIIKLSQDLLNKASDPVQRQQHPKSHGCVKAEFTVEDVPEHFRIGVFKEPRTYRAWIRFSNGSSNVQSDLKGDVRGMAIKLVGVSGEKLLEDERNAETQDFILINYPVLFLQDAQDTLAISKALLAVKNMPIAPLKPLPFLLMFAPFHRKQVGILKTIRQQQMANPLQAKYWSTTPYQLGSHAIKFAAIPRELESMKAGVPTSKSDNFFREAMVQQLSQQDVYFDFAVQVQTNAERMPIEDATVEWSEQESPFIKVATIRIPKQQFDTESRRAFDENLSFNPWHALPEHKPLGGVNRVRKKVYQVISKLRHQLNQKNKQEPKDEDFDSQP